MTDEKIQPALITKPMQLLAAWLVGLLAIDGSFLIAASRMAPGSSDATALVWAAIFNVPLFLAALFMLQTKFRPELQEDLYYSTYISQKTNEKISLTRDDQRFSTVLGGIERLEKQLLAIKTVDAPDENILENIVIGINKHFPDKNELSARIRELGVPSHTYFGGESLPDGRVVAISEYMPMKTRAAVLELVKKLGFTRYTFFDDHFEETSEDVLIGAYGAGEYDVV